MWVWLYLTISETPPTNTLQPGNDESILKAFPSLSLSFPVLFPLPSLSFSSSKWKLDQKSSKREIQTRDVFKLKPSQATRQALGFGSA